MLTRRTLLPAFSLLTFALAFAEQALAAPIPTLTFAATPTPKVGDPVTITMTLDNTGTTPA